MGIVFVGGEQWSGGGRSYDPLQEREKAGSHGR